MHEQGSSLVAVHASGTPARHCGRLCCTAPDGGKAGGGPPDKTRWAPDGKCHPESGERSVFMRARAPWQKAGRTRRVVLRGPRGAPPLKRATARSVSKPPCEPAAARASNDSGHGQAARAPFPGILRHGRPGAVIRAASGGPPGSAGVPPASSDVAALTENTPAAPVHSRHAGRAPTSLLRLRSVQPEREAVGPEPVLSGAARRRREPCRCHAAPVERVAAAGFRLHGRVCVPVPEQRGPFSII